MFLIGFGLLCLACGIVIGIAATLWIQEVEENRHVPRPSKHYHPLFGYMDR